MWSRSLSRALGIGLAVAVFLICSALPLAYMLARPATEALGFEALRLDARQRGLLVETAALGAGTAFLATLVGAPLGVALARADLPARTALRALLAAPLALPPYVVGLAWVMAAGKGTWIYSTSGAIAVLTLVFYPLSMLATEAAIRRIEPRLEEAALLAAPPPRVLWSITLPLAAPGILAAALVIFVLAVSEFGVPGLLRVRVFTTEVFTAFAALYDFGRATVLSIPLVLLAGVVAALAVALVGDRLIATGRGAVSGHLSMLRAAKPLTLAACAIAALALVFPVGVLIHEAFGVRSLASVLRGSGATIGRSLLLSCAVSALALGFGLALGYARARAPRGLGAACDVAFLSLFAAPSTVFGVGLIGVWNRPGAWGALYGTDAMLLLACLGRVLPVAALVSGAAFRQVPTSHEEAAAASGARWPRTMAEIVVPQTSTSLATLGVVVFLLAFGELGASILVAPPGEATLPIRIYTLIANAPPAEIAALALLQAAVALAPFGLVAWVAGLREAR